MTEQCKVINILFRSVIMILVGTSLMTLYRTFHYVTKTLWLKSLILDHCFCVRVSSSSRMMTVHCWVRTVDFGNSVPIYYFEEDFVSIGMIKDRGNGVHRAWVVFVSPIDHPLPTSHLDLLLEIVVSCDDANIVT